MKRLSLLTISFVLFLSHSSSGSEIRIDRLEASVNSRIILMSDIFDFKKTSGLRAQLDPLFNGTPLSKRSSQAKDQEIVDFLIEENLILEQFPVKNEEIEQEIKSIQASNNISRENLVEALNQQGYSFSDYFKLISTSIAKRNLIDRDIRTKVHISDDDVKNYFYNHYEGPKSSLAYRIKIITVTPSNYKRKTAALEIAQKALREIKAGDSFEEVAKRYSDGPTATSGGDLGLMSPSEMSPVIKTEIRKLNVGQVSSLLGTSDTTYFIIKLADIKSGQEKKLDSLKEKIRAQLTAKEYQHQIGLWLEREKQKAFVHLAGTSSIPKKSRN